MSVVISLRTGNSLERNIMQFFGRNFLTSSYMFAKFIICHHLEMKAVPSLDRAPIHFPVTQCLARKQWNPHSIK